jgi:hypothetical protein
MAHRDRSQGFGFVYLDLAKFIAERDELEKKHGNGHYPPSHVPSINFNKDPQVAPEIPTQTPKSARTEAISQIRENLDRLQSLHHKLHAMLEDLNHITGREKKKADEK